MAATLVEAGREAKQAVMCRGRWPMRNKRFPVSVEEVAIAFDAPVAPMNGEATLWRSWPSSSTLIAIRFKTERRVG